MLPILAIIYITQQATFFPARTALEGRAVEVVQMTAWTCLSLVLLAALVTGGSWFQSQVVREILNDETARENRREGMRAGFIAGMVGAMVVGVASLFKPVDGGEAARVIMGIGLGAALLRFGTLERRGHGDCNC